MDKYFVFYNGTLPSKKIIRAKNLEDAKEQFRHFYRDYGTLTLSSIDKDVVETTQNHYITHLETVNAELTKTLQKIKKEITSLPL